jgi:hypothetical protein
MLEACLGTTEATKPEVNQEVPNEDMTVETIVSWDQQWTEALPLVLLRIHTAF